MHFVVWLRVEHWANQSANINHMAYSWAEIKRFDRRQKQKRHIVAKKAHKLLAPFSDQFVCVCRAA